MATYKTIECDVLAVGGAAAGCGAAIRATDSIERVVLVDKGKVGKSGVSPFAAGVWSIKFPEDDTDVWMREEIEHGEYLSDQEWVKVWLEQIYPVSMELDEWGQQYGMNIFEKDDKGDFVFRKARSHVNTRTCCINSLSMMETMRKKAQEKGAVFVERTIVTDLVTYEGKVVGAIGFNYRTGDVYLFKAKAVVAAAGKHFFGTTFIATKNLAGDVIAAAYEAGAITYKFEQITTNTCARDFAIHGLNLIVASGGRFLNARGEEFAWDYDPVLGNRATLPTLVQSFCSEAKEGRGPIYLDMSSATPENQQLMRKLLPETFLTLDRSGINFFKDKIPWGLAMQGGGGIYINSRCETSMPGLYAAGDDTGRPKVGIGNLGGHNIGFAYLSGLIAGQNAAQYASGIKDPGWEKADLDVQVKRATNNFLTSLDKSLGIRPKEVIQKIREVIIPWPVGYIRNEERLLKALVEIERIRHEDIPDMKADGLHELARAQEAKSLGLMAELTLRCALFRKESRGYHRREDYPYTDNQSWLKWVMVKKEDGLPKVWAEDVPTPYVRPGNPIEIPPGIKKTKGGN